MNNLLALLVMALFGPLLIMLTIATLAAVPIGVTRFDVKAGRFVPGTGEVMWRIYVIATLAGVLVAVLLLIGGLLAIL